jgi:hypothetical protein
MTNDGGACGGMTLGDKLIKNLTAVASGTASTIDVSAMEENIAGSYSAADVTLTGLVTNTGLLTVLVDTNIQLDALIAGAGAITAEAASTLNAPLFPTDGTINLKDGTAGVANGADVTVKSLTAIADLADAATIKSLTIGAQAADVSLVLSTFAAMSTLNYKGVAATTAAGQTNDLTIGPMAGGSASLTTIDFTGNGGISNLTVMAAGLTSLSTVGALRSITVTSTGAGATAAALDAITIGNTGLNGGAAGVVSITQTGISSLDLSGWNWIKAIELIGNTSMTAMTFPSATTTVTSAGPTINKTVTVTGNAIAGSITAPVDSTESNVFVESSLSGVGFTNAKTWLTWLTNQSTAGGVTYTLEIDADDGDIQTVASDGGTDGVSATAIWNSTSEIDIIGELGLLPN